MSDSVLEGWDSIGGLAQREYVGSYVTYPESGADFNNRRNTSVRDGFSIARQLIRDMNTRGLGFGLRMKSLVHMSTVSDVRKDLVAAMRENSSSRSSYLASSGAQYMFVGYRRANGKFHVLRLDYKGLVVDVDMWHGAERVDLSLTK